MDLKIKGNKDFVSICIPWFNRPQYANRVINSIREHADFPFELVIHDDHSTDNATEVLFQNRSKISTLILSSGNQLGLAASANRCIEMAGSEYIVFMNADCAFNRPFLKDVVNVLNNNFVGWIDLLGECNESPEHLKNGDTKFSIFSGIGSGGAMAFTRNVFDRVGGFDDMVRSGCSDSSFQYPVWANGYFRVKIVGDRMVRNLSTEEKGNTDSSIGKSGWDAAMPLVFNSDSYNDWCKKRWEHCEQRFRDLENKPENRGNVVTDINYWHSWTRGLIPEDGKVSTINWKDYGDKYNHIIWKEEIEDLLSES